MRSFSTVAAIGIFASKAMAQTADFNPKITFSNLTVGQVQVIGWSAGDGTPVSLFVGNTTANTPIFENKSATDAAFDWTVSIPAGWIAGNYALALVQTGAMDFSPLFSVIPPGYVAPAPTSTSSTTPMSTPPTTMAPTPSGNMTDNAVITSQPMVTVTVWDEDCTCHKTSSMPASSCATATGAAGTQYMWYDNECGCTKTAMAPAPTTNMGTNNYTAPAGGNVPVAPAAPSSPTTPAITQQTQPGAASRIGGSVLAVMGLAAVAMFA